MSKLDDRLFFLYVGTDKAASTWLYGVLHGHPHCFVPEIKDLYYFDREYHRGRGWYDSYFERVGEGHSAVGELSHDYMYSPLACMRIKRDFPHAKIVVGIREPVSRAFSNYLFLRRHGLTKAPFLEAVDRFPELVEHGLYDEAIRRQLNHFGRDNVFVMNFDRVKVDSVGAAEDVCHFLGLDPRLAVLDAAPTLPAARPRSPLVSYVAKNSALLLRRAGMLRAIGRIKGSAMVQGVLYREYDEYPKLTPQEREVVASYFVADLRALEGTLGIDLSGWYGQGTLDEDAPE